MISLRQFYLAALFAPLVIPALVWIAIFLGASGINSPSEGIALLKIGLGILMIGFPFYGAPYIIFLIVLFRLFQNKDTQYISRISFLIPLLFLPFLIGVILVFSIFDHIGFNPNFMSDKYWGDLFITSLYASGLELLFGYGYVFLVHILALLLKFVHFIRKVDSPRRKFITLPS